MSNKRDNFTQKTIEILRNRVAHRCSNPECRIVTTGPTTDPNKVNSVGEAAHIYAAAPGGPRYNKSMTRLQRKSIDNAIWLCSNCADKIDKDSKRYPVELLNEWKKITEALSYTEIGQRLPEISEPMELLISSMTGTGLKVMPDRLGNISLAASQYLESIDPRLSVAIAFDKNYTTFSFAAKKEPVDMKLSIAPKDFKSFDKKMKNLFKYGEPMEASVNDFSFHGSEIFDKLKQNSLTNAKISFTPKGVDGKLKLKLTNSGEVYQVDDMLGTFFSGNQNISFQGKLFGDILHFSLRIPLPTQPSTAESNFSFSIKFDNWNGTDILSVPYFNKTYEFFEKLYLGFSLGGFLEIEGEKLLSMNDKQFNEDSSIVEMYSIFRYIYLVRKILKYFGKQLIFDRFEFYYDDLNKMENIVNAIEKYKVELKEGDTLKFSMRIESEEHLMSLKNNKNKIEPIQIRMEVPEYNLNLFGQNILIPKISQMFTKIKLKEAKNYDSIKVGDKMEYEYIVQKDSFYSTELMET